MNKKIGAEFAIIAIIAVTIFAGCIEKAPSCPLLTPVPSPTPTSLSTPKVKIVPTPSPGTGGNQSLEETLRIGAFNLQAFGTTKASKPEVMDVFAKIIRTYDVVALEEIRDESQTALPALVDTVNSDGSQYGYVVSERLGRTTSKEQYAYIYDMQTIELTNTPFTYPEPNSTDPFHREPYIATFKALNGNFDVTLITIHADPDEATEEINALDAVVKYAQVRYPDE